MTRQEYETPAGDKPAGVSKKPHLQRASGASLSAADMARKALIEQLGLAMLAAQSANDMSEMNRYKDLMYAEIKRISPQAANSRHAEIDHEIGNVPPIVQQQHARRHHAIEEAQ